MGLDMYAYSIKADLVEGLGDVDVAVYQAAAKPYMKTDSQLTKSEATALAVEDGVLNPDLAYWRKFNHLHGWMERLYQAKGGSQEFICTTVRIEQNDLKDLKQDLLEGRLTPTSGFFFGNETLHPEDTDSLLDFINRANQSIEDGYAVFYASSW